MYVEDRIFITEKSLIELGNVHLFLCENETWCTKIILNKKAVFSVVKRAHSDFAVDNDGSKFFWLKNDQTNPLNVYSCNFDKLKDFMLANTSFRFYLMPDPIVFKYYLNTCHRQRRVAVMLAHEGHDPVETVLFIDHLSFV